MTRQEQLSELSNRLTNADVNDDAVFSRLVSLCIEHVPLKEEDIARKFTMSRPSINRWKNGRNAPHPAMRRPVFDYLLASVKDAMKKEKRVASDSGGFSTSVWPAAARGR